MVAAIALLAGPELDGPAQAATRYWDTDGSTAGNDASTGANLGGSGLWSAGDANWWDTGLGTLQNWADGGDAVFWGTAGAVTLRTSRPTAWPLRPPVTRLTPAP